LYSYFALRITYARWSLKFSVLANRWSGKCTRFVRRREEIDVEMSSTAHRSELARYGPSKTGTTRGLMVAFDRLCQAVCGDRPIPTLESCVSMAPPKNAPGLAFGVQTNSLRYVFVRDLEEHTTERESGSSSGT
jgi:hypothetical protein